MSASAGSTAVTAGFGGIVVDSVDADDGTVSGHCVPCDSWFVSAGSSGVRFTFSAAVLGTLSTRAGIVWTDGNNPITFEAFGPGGVSLGTVTGTHADGSVGSGAIDDRFYGVHNEAAWRAS